MSTIKYHFDEHMDNAIVSGLRRRGIDVTTTVEAELLTASDPEQIEFAAREGRVFVTCDRKISTHVPNGATHAGIVILRPGRKMIGPNVNLLAHLCRDTTAEQLTNHIRYLTPES